MTAPETAAASEAGAAPGLKVLVREAGPLLAVLLGWLSVAGKAPKYGNPAIWLVGAFTLPSLVLLAVAAVRVWRSLHPAAAAAPAAGAAPGPQA